MEKDNLSEMRTLKEYLEENGKKIENIRYIGKIDIEEIINNKPYLLEKDIYICEERIVDKNGKEINVEKFYTEDFECIAMKNEKFGILLKEQYEEHPEIIEKLEELDQKGLIDLKEENLKESVKIAETLGIDKEKIENISEIDLRRLDEPEKNNQIEAKAKVQMNANEKITTRDSMATMLGVEGKGYTKIAVVDSKELKTQRNTTSYAFVGVKENGQMEEIDSLVQVYGTKPDRNINAISADGTKVQEERTISMYRVKGREDEQLAIGKDGLNTTRVSLVRTSPETNESISIPIEANTIAKTSHEDKEFMDSRKNPKVTAETKRIEKHKKENCEPSIKDIDDDPTNDTHEHDDGEYIPGTDITWIYFANQCGYRGEGAIEKAKEEFYKAKGKAKEYSNEEVVKAVVKEKEEDFEYDKSIPQE